MSKEQLISEAQKYLTEQPFDAGHDLDHHMTVVQLALNIASHVEEEVDREALEIAAMWHDVVTQPNPHAHTLDKNEIKQQTCKHLRSRLEQVYPAAFVEKVITAVQFHSYADVPKNPEGRVLYDADKLAMIDKSRWQKIIEAYVAGKIGQDDYDKYIFAGKQWLREMREKLHFACSKELFFQRITALSQDEWASRIVTDYGIRFEDLLSTETE